MSVRVMGQEPTSFYVKFLYRARMAFAQAGAGMKISLKTFLQLDRYLNGPVASLVKWSNRKIRSNS